MSAFTQIDNIICSDERKILTPLRVFLILSQFILQNTNPKSVVIKKNWGGKHLTEEEKAAKKYYCDKVFDKLPLEKGIVAVNTNSKHKSLLAYADYEKKVPKNTKKTKKQGDGTSFNAALEIAFAKNIDKNGKKMEKIYKTKCFIVGGKFQVPGTVDKNLTDAKEIVADFVKIYRKYMKEKIEVIQSRSEMRNYICKVVLEPQQEIDIKKLMILMTSEWSNVYAKYSSRNTVVLLSVIEDSTVKSPKIKLFRKGTIKFLGKYTDENVIKHYQRFSEVIEKNKKILIYIPG